MLIPLPVGLRQWRTYTICILLVLFHFLDSTTYAQQNTYPPDQNQSIKISGSFSTHNRFYAANGIENRQDPYILTLRGRLNMTYKGIAIPISGIFTTQNSNLNQPFNRISVRPRYKWAQAHLGYSNMTYSQYTLAGHTFLGGGIELNPKGIRFAANYGRFATAIPQDRAVNQIFVPSFDRFGYGGKIGYGTADSFIDFIFFNAADREESSNMDLRLPAALPAENMVLGVAWSFAMVKNLRLSGEIARSAFTPDKRTKSISEQEPFFSALGFENRSATNTRNAFQVAATYAIQQSRLSAKYERIEPHYRSMGAYFFNNDIENITIGYSISLFENKLFLALNGGFQRNNLFGNRLSQTNRTIASANILYTKRPLTLGLNFTNYSADVQYVLNNDLDSLNAVVVTQAVALNGSYILKSTAGKMHILSSNLARQAITDDFLTGTRGEESTMFTGVLSYSYRLLDRKMEFSARLNYNRNDLGNEEHSRIGPGLGFKKRFFKDRCSVRATVNYFTASDNQTLQFMMAGSLQLQSKHHLRLTLSNLQRSIDQLVAENRTYGESIAAINYAYQF